MRIGVVGGGISGLSCAYYLGKLPIETTVFDPTPGGLIGTVTVEGCRLETGPESWLASKPWAEDLIRELGLGDQTVGSNDARRGTYIYRNKRFERLPEGLQLVVPTRIAPLAGSHLLSWGTKFRMAAEIFRNPKALPDRSVAEFVEDHFGREAVDYLAEPLLSGVYGGSPEELSAPGVLPKFVEHEQRFGSIIVGALREKPSANGRPVFKSMRDGMGTLTDVLRARTSVVGENVESIQARDKGWQLYAGGEWHEFDRIVLACGANRCARLLAPVDSRASELLASIPYTSSAIWSLGYRREDVPHPLDAFGFLVPARERHGIMACTWVATKWPGRIPDDKAVLRCFSTDISVSRQAIRDDLNRLMGITAEPLFAVQHLCPDAMPQYTVGHTERILDLDSHMRSLFGLHLCGNSYFGIGIPDCVRSGKRTAETIAGYLS